MRCRKESGKFGVALFLLFLTVFGLTASVHAGAYIFAGEANGVDLILHPQGYTGTENTLTVNVCIDPTTLVPAGAVLTDLEKAVQNNIAIWNQLQPIVGNSIHSTANNIPAGELDFESVALHELGHCIGLAHVNAASESGLVGDDSNYTKATDGSNNVFNVNAGVDGVRGTLDDVRGDDVNLHWFRMDTNDPGELPLPVPVDSTTYDRDQISLPAGDNFAQNLDRDAAFVMGHPSAYPIETEAVMQQGTFTDEDQRRLTADGAATVLLGMSGLDETAGTGDDYVINLVYGGISAGCDLSMKFTNMGGLAFCSVSASSINSNHWRISSGSMEFGNGYNWFFNQEGPCRQTFDLTANQWKQIALSCNPPSGSDTLADLFGDDLAGTYDVDWVVYERDAANDVYVKLALTDTLAVGRGYWIKTGQTGQTVNIEEDFNGDADFPLDSDAAGRFNMVGHRYWYDQDWADVRVIDGASELTLDQADPAGACQGLDPLANGCVMSSIAHKWNGASYDAFNGATPGMEGTLENFDGFWVKAFKSGIALRIPNQWSTPNAPHSETLAAAPAELIETAAAEVLETVSAGSAETAVQTTISSAEQLSNRVREPYEGWYIRLIAESGKLRDSGNVFGQLPDSVSGYDAHDLIELPVFGGDFLTVVFPHPEWQQAGDYASNFHRLQQLKTRDRWDFEVRSSQPTAPVTLSWDGPENKLIHSTLVDRETKEKIEIAPGGTHTFVMNAPSRRFTWVIKEKRRPQRRR